LAQGAENARAIAKPIIEQTYDIMGLLNAG
jgi:hypothetical protein